MNSEPYAMVVLLPRGEGPRPETLKTRGAFCRFPVPYGNAWAFKDWKDGDEFYHRTGGREVSWSEVSEHYRKALGFRNPRGVYI